MMSQSFNRAIGMLNEDFAFERGPAVRPIHARGDEQFTIGATTGDMFHVAPVERTNQVGWTGRIRTRNSLQRDARSDVDVEYGVGLGNAIGHHGQVTVLVTIVCTADERTGL